MRPVVHQTHKAHRPSFRMTLRTALKALCICLISVTVSAAVYVRLRSF